MILLFGLLSAELGVAQYQPVDRGSEVKFTIRNFGFGVDGSFKGLEGSIHFDPEHPAEGHFDVSIDAGTVNTDNSLRDGHLRDDGYFDVQHYPRIRLVSTAIVSKGGGLYQLTGQLTIKNVTKEVSFPFSVQATGEGPRFSGSFTINRKDFGVGGNSTISNELTVTLEVLATKQ